MKIKRLRPEKVREGLKVVNAETFYQEALRYYENAKEKLKEARIEYNRYKDVKPVRKACGICYLGVLLVLDGYFIKRGVSIDNLPTTTEGYWAYIKKYLVHNGKLVNAFSNSYESLHIFGYYRGGAVPEIVKAGFHNAKLLIDTISKSDKRHR